MRKFPVVPKGTLYNLSVHYNVDFQPGNKAVEIKFLFSLCGSLTASVIEPLCIPVLISPPFHMLLQVFNIGT
jgi:hypothetical protein